jgi:CBS domain-containing protein
MSARAAWRLESLGFRQVHRYTAGKADWMANGLPIEGERAGARTVGQLARRGVPTCRLEERVDDVRARVEAAGWDMCVVVNDRNVVLGRLRKEALSVDASTPVEKVMLPGPKTLRLNESVEETARNMAEANVDRVLVTTGDGELVGVFFREDAGTASGQDGKGADEGG